MTSYEEFIAKVKQDTSSYLSLKELMSYVDGKHEPELYLVVHGSQALVKLDVKVSALEVQYENAQLKDAELRCILNDGRYFSIAASTLLPPAVIVKVGKINHSRMFSSKQARDVFFDGIVYNFEVEEELFNFESQRKQEQFLSWFVRRMSGPEESKG